MSGPIPFWVTDPTGNNNPYLEITLPFWIVILPNITKITGAASNFPHGTPSIVAIDTAVTTGSIPSASVTWTTREFSFSGQTPPGPVIFSGSTSSGAVGQSANFVGNNFVTQSLGNGHFYQSVAPIASSGDSTQNQVWVGSGSMLPGAGTSASMDPTSTAFIPPVSSDQDNTNWSTAPLSATYNFYGDTITSADIYGPNLNPGIQLWATTNGPDEAVFTGGTSNSPNKILTFSFNAFSITASSTGGGRTVTYVTVAAARVDLSGDVHFLMRGS